MTDAMKALLRDMKGGERRSGKFWVALGNPIQSITALERRGMIRQTIYGPTVLTSQYQITPTGLAALD